MLISENMPRRPASVKQGEAQSSCLLGEKLSLGALYPVELVHICDLFQVSQALKLHALLSNGLSLFLGPFPVRCTLAGEFQDEGDHEGADDGGVPGAGAMRRW